MKTTAEQRAWMRVVLDNLVLRYLTANSPDMELHIDHIEDLLDDLDELLAERDRMREALRTIAESPHCSYEYLEGERDRNYAIGVADGHRCAAATARKALGVKP